MVPFKLPKIVLSIIDKFLCKSAISTTISENCIVDFSTVFETKLSRAEDN